FLGPINVVVRTFSFYAGSEEFGRESGKRQQPQEETLPKFFLPICIKVGCVKDNYFKSTCNLREVL
ncbi:MAG: hypothetical protein ABWU13_05265, partial [Limnospira maxima]